MASAPLTLMAVHAHPDDEATSTGGILARYAAEGITTVLVTCTDGRCGDGPGGGKPGLVPAAGGRGGAGRGGVKPGEDGKDPKAVAAMRHAELTASCAAL